MTKVKHYSKANLLWNNIAYCDQWKRVMAVYDEKDNLRAVIKDENDDMLYYNYSVLLIGDDKNTIYELHGIELGSTNKNLKACFDIYRQLQYEDTPSYTPSSHRQAKQIRLYQIFPRTKDEVRHNGSFSVTNEDISDRIANALKKFDEIKYDVEVVYGVDQNYSEYADDVYDLASTLDYIGRQ